MLTDPRITFGHPRYFSMIMCAVLLDTSQVVTVTLPHIVMEYAVNSHAVVCL